MQPNQHDYIDLFAGLAAPFANDEVRTRSQGGREFQYITARTAMNRLDEVLGPANWWDVYESKDNYVVCKLSIMLPDGRVLTKSDAGGFTTTADTSDYEKSGFSDAFKRAAVKFGVARYLYGDGVPPSIREALIRQRRELREQQRQQESAGREPGSDDGPREHEPQDAPDFDDRPRGEPGRGGGRDFNGAPPKTGKALFAWVKERDEKLGVELLKLMSDWGKHNHFPARMVDWNDEQVSEGHSEALRILESAKLDGGDDPSQRIVGKANGQPPARRSAPRR